MIAGQDPEAARVTVNCGADITLVPLDATHHGGVVTLEDCKQLRALGTPAGEAAAIFAERRAGAYADRQVRFPWMNPDFLFKNPNSY